MHPRIIFIVTVLALLRSFAHNLRAVGLPTSGGAMRSLDLSCCCALRTRAGYRFLLLARKAAVAIAFAIAR